VKLLDLFCGAGGAAVGYHRAGFTEILGVDHLPQPRYPFAFEKADALEFLAGVQLGDYDLIHASPPCQAYSVTRHAAKNEGAHAALVPAVRSALRRIGTPFVIENVVGAPLISPALLCGLSLGLRVRRHRWFECPYLLLAPPCSGHDQEYFVIYGHEVRSRRTGAAAGRKNALAAGRQAMGIDWMTRAELSQAIPPAYTEWIGAQLLPALKETSP
jgi:DNA (cytosine-5)-methyltransferase 1